MLAPMSPTKPGGGASALLLQAVESLRCDIQELKAALNKHTDDEHRFRLDYEVRHADVINKASAAHTRMDGLEKITTQNTADIAKNADAISKLDKSIQPLLFQSKIVGWFAITLAISVIGLVWSIITHQVTLTFP